MIRKQNYKAALYCRLSVDDGNFGGSVSIETQKVLLEQYCKDHSITDYTFYCDDGCSGTNFDRDAFRQMYKDIQNGKIDLVVVKDLSQFGRNYVETGMYVREFTDNNIRFIAADDNYDSLVNGDDLLFPIKNVVNEMYARDVSKKTKAAKKAKARDGQFIASKAPFGYKIDPADRHHLIIDEPAAQVVKRIFRLAAEGISYNKMAKMFCEEKVLTPIAYFNKNNPDYFKSDYWSKEFDWHVTSIRTIPDNEVYLGQLVYLYTCIRQTPQQIHKEQGKSKEPARGMDSRRKLPRAYHHKGTLGHGSQDIKRETPPRKNRRNTDVCGTALLHGLRTLSDVL